MTNENNIPRLTRDDVLRLIAENGGTAKGLDFSGQIFQPNIDLTGLDLKGVIMRSTIFYQQYVDGKPFGAKFNGSDLEGADFRESFVPDADFGMLDNKRTILKSVDFRNAQMQNANFRYADLSHAQLRIDKDNKIITSAIGADFRDAKLYNTDFTGCDCSFAKFEGAYIRSVYGTNVVKAVLEQVDWGNHIIGEEKDKDYYHAEQCYRQLKAWYNNAGYADIAAKFYYREKETVRKSLKLVSKKTWNHRLALEFMRTLFGYGEHWEKILVWSVGIIIILAIIYRFSGVTIQYALYYSTVSFSALGYGGWVQVPQADWVQTIGAIESLLGVLMMALLLVTFVRKWTR